MSIKQTRATEIHSLKSRITDLEDQVVDYKKRLDELRKAKNTTVLKREREVVEISAPILGRRRTSKPSLERVPPPANEDVDTPHSDKCACHVDEIAAMKLRICELEDDNAALIVENSEIKKQANTMLEELSAKEATWCELEEKMSQKIKCQWEVKYRKWMDETEKQIADLYKTNAVLRTMLEPADTTDTTRDSSTE